MSETWYPGIKAFCSHWKDAAMLQQTFDTLEQEFASDNDACIDAAKAIVECACRVILANLDDPTSPLTPPEQNPDFGAWLSSAVRVLQLDQVRDTSFRKLISQYHKLATSLGDLRNTSGAVSHGRDGFLLKLSVHQRRAALLAADAIIMFLHEAYLEHEPELVRTREPYERFARMNALIDRNVGVAALESEFDAAVDIAISLPNDDVITLTVEASRLLFEFDRDAYVAALIASREADAETRNSDIVDVNHV
jgi:hypothetical protein